MSLKTDYPLRSRDNAVGKAGTVGLCVFVDLEKQKRRETRTLAVAASRRQTIDRAIAEVSLTLEPMDRGTVYLYLAKKNSA